MGQRLDLQQILESILGSRNVYFQPPPSVKMQYPCIVYHLDNMPVDHADNVNFLTHKLYGIQLISRDPENPSWDKLAGLPYCRFVRFYAMDNLNHNIFNLYY